MATRRTEANPPKRSLTPREVAAIRKVDDEINRVITEPERTDSGDVPPPAPTNDETPR
jgi:hypothetical protein